MSKFGFNARATRLSLIAKPLNLLQFNKKILIILFEEPDIEQQKPSLLFLQSFFRFTCENLLLTSKSGKARNVVAERLLLDFSAQAIEQICKQPSSVKGVLGFGILETLLRVIDSGLFAQVLNDFVAKIRQVSATKFIVILENFRKCMFTLKRRCFWRVPYSDFSNFRFLKHIIENETDQEKVTTMVSFCSFLLYFYELNRSELFNEFKEICMSIESSLKLEESFDKLLKLPFDASFSEKATPLLMYIKEVLFLQGQIIRSFGCLFDQYEDLASSKNFLRDFIKNVLSLENDIVSSGTIYREVYIKLMQAGLHLLRLRCKGSSSSGGSQAFFLENIESRIGRILAVLDMEISLKHLDPRKILFNDSSEMLRRELTHLVKSNTLVQSSLQVEQALELTFKVLRLVPHSRKQLLEEYIQISMILSERLDIFSGTLLQICSLKGGRVVDVIFQGERVGHFIKKVESMLETNGKQLSQNEVDMLGYFFNAHPEKFDLSIISKVDYANIGCLKTFTTLVKFILLRGNSKAKTLLESVGDYLMKKGLESELKSFLLDILNLEEKYKSKGLKKMPTFYQKICLFASKTAEKLSKENKVVIAIQLIEGMSSQKMSKEKVDKKVREMFELLCQKKEKEIQNSIIEEVPSGTSLIKLISKNSESIQNTFFKTMIRIQKDSTEMLEKKKSFLIEEILGLLDLETSTSKKAFRISVPALALAIHLCNLLISGDKEATRFQLPFTMQLRKLRKHRKRVIRKVVGYIRLDQQTS